MTKINNLVITIQEASDDDGFFYDIYNCESSDFNEDTESLDGGHCTSNDIKNAIDMAMAQAQTLCK